MSENQSGVLYICGTPIGNLEDMTYRAVRILREVNVVAAEDTRHTRKLLNHFEIHTQLLSYHEHNKTFVGPQIIERLLTGDSVAVVSDAGMPGISDPGADLVKLAIEAGIEVIPVPGASAALCALVASGLDTRTFSFIGFPPKTAKKRRELFQRLADTTDTLIFYEAPHHLRATLADLTQALGQRPAAVARELTKKFEQFIRGTLGEISEHFQQHEPRGECTIIVAGRTEERLQPAQPADDPVEAVAALIAGGINKKDAIRKVASERGLSKRAVYNALLDKNSAESILD